jgi:hypothetical protein
MNIQRRVRHTWYEVSKDPGIFSLTWVQLFDVERGTSMNFGDSLMLVIEQLISEGHSNWLRPVGIRPETLPEGVSHETRQ